MFRFCGFQRQMLNEGVPWYSVGPYPRNFMDRDTSQSVDGLYGKQLSSHGIAFCLGFTMYWLHLLHCSPLFWTLKQSSWCTAIERKPCSPCRGPWAAFKKDLAHLMGGLGCWMVTGLSTLGTGRVQSSACWYSALWDQTGKVFLHTLSTSVLWMPSTHFEHFVVVVVEASASMPKEIWFRISAAQCPAVAILGNRVEIGVWHCQGMDGHTDLVHPTAVKTVPFTSTAQWFPSPRTPRINSPDS